MSTSEHSENLLLKPVQRSATRKAKKRRKGHVLVGRTTCTECNKVLAYCSVKSHMNTFHAAPDHGSYVCRAEGCFEKFDSQAQRYKHLIQDHGHQPKERKKTTVPPPSVTTCVYAQGYPVLPYLPQDVCQSQGFSSAQKKLQSLHSASRRIASTLFPCFR